MADSRFGSWGLLLLFGLAGLLAILKLAGMIRWPWLWVCSPLWVSALLLVIVLWLLNIAAFMAQRKRLWASRL